MYPEFAYLKIPVLAGLYITVIPFSIALVRTFKLLRGVEENKIFSEGSVNALRDIKYCLISILLFYVMGSIFLMTQSAFHPGIAIMGFTVMFITTFIALFSTVLQRLLRNALNIKSENDLIV
ncbi:DUF2975 domain-containing protein [Salinibacillus xinjiangensis]|uniref:DUF2975 domain-containing protein n=1 Tax=Salinibacillus xinjiangensis TaxID=1229268 RepID=UPI001E440D9B|nr:DUF2975 domain-containing protein [Salinibacillus xinjiangensis]